MRNLSAGHDYLLINKQRKNELLLIRAQVCVLSSSYLTNYLIRLSSYDADSLFCVYVLMAKLSLLVKQKHPHRNLFLEVFCFLWLSLKPICTTTTSWKRKEMREKSLIIMLHIFKSDRWTHLWCRYMWRLSITFQVCLRWHVGGITPTTAIRETFDLKWLSCFQ